jgi:type II secretory pathway component PulF
VICPLCGNDQPIAPECARCGVIFERMHTLGRPRVVRPAPELAPILESPTPAARVQETLRKVLSTRPATLKHRHVFFVQLGRMLQSGVPLDESLQRIGDVVGRSVMHRAAVAMAADVRQGLTLSAAMTEQGAVFDEVERAVVAAAEHVGDLPRAANRLAKRVEEARGTSKILLRATAYPVFLVTMSLLLDPLPVLVLQGFGAYMAALALPLLVWLTLLATGLVLIPHLLARPVVRSHVLDTLGALPLIHILLRNRRYALAFDVLAQALEAGLPLARCIELACRAPGEAQMVTAGQMVAMTVDKGATLAAASLGLPGLDSASRATIAAGERTGHLPETFEELAKERQQAWQGQLKLAAAAFGVAMTLGSAAWVAYSLIQQVQSGVTNSLNGLPKQDLRDLQRALGPELFK